MILGFKWDLKLLKCKKYIRRNTLSVHNKFYTSCYSVNLTECLKFENFLHNLKIRKF